MTKRILILEMGPLPEDVQKHYPQYAPFFEALLAHDALEFTSLNIYAGDPLPEPQDYDGYIITGSKHGVYENLPWMLSAQEFIRATAKARIPMIGICFGHQIMAQAMGGEVIKSPKGWGLGVLTYDVSPNSYAGKMPEEMQFNAVHQDQVVKKPDDAEVFASSDFCEYAGLIYGGDKPYAISIQPHPEFDAEFTKELINARRGELFPEDQSDAAIASQSKDNNREKWGSFLAGFLARD